MGQAPGSQVLASDGHPPVVDARPREASVRCQRQSVATAHAKPDDSDASGAPVVIPEPAAGPLDVVERPSPTFAEVAHDRTQTTQPGPPVVQVRSYREEPLVRQPVGLRPKVVAHAGEIMDHHDTGPRRRCRRHRAVRRYEPLLGLNLHFQCRLHVSQCALLGPALRNTRTSAWSRTTGGGRRPGG